MEIYPGGAALSSFRAKKLLEKVRRIDQRVSKISAQFVHFVDSDKPLSKSDKELLSNLLPAGEVAEAGELFLVVPRPGTISPWSSKATDIVHNAGLLRINRVERGTAYRLALDGEVDRTAIAGVLHDRMTESVLASLADAALLFSDETPRPLTTVPFSKDGRAALARANVELGLALADDEIDYLAAAYAKLKRDPTDVELMMFGVVNSEHCRHKIFNAEWQIDDEKQPKSLFKMIRNTYEQGHEGVLSAYSDNAAVLEGPTAGRFFADPSDHAYGYRKEKIHSVIKVETHNHPTAIAPAPGAATGIGGEIRDEAATGRGAKSKMGLSGFSVSNLNLPGAEREWEKPYGKPDRIVSALDVMLDGPIGGAAFANEFGRPNLGGYFRTLEVDAGGQRWGYHKPIMIAGGLGNIRDGHVAKRTLKPGTKIVVLGGPSMLIGLGGGAASSMHSGSSEAELDFASVQRANAEVERRAQEVIDTCWSMGDDNPIITIHDVGAGGLSNALPELVHDSDLGGTFELRDIPSAEPGLSPMEIWCNEAQERYVLGIDEKDLALFDRICKRERCLYAVVGQATADDRLVVNDRLLGTRPIDLPMSTLFGKPPKMTRQVKRKEHMLTDFETKDIELNEAVKRVLQLPAVASKKFLITIGDRSVGGLVARDQLVGPWQVPVSDVAVSAVGFDSDAGEAMAMGERTPLAILNAPASARIAIGEAVTNILAADIERLSDIKLSANWMAAAGHEQEDQHLYDTVKTVGEDFCPALSLTIPVGKDSLSMRTTWQDETGVKAVTSPVSLVISAFAPVSDVRRTLTPLLKTDEPTALILIDLGQGANRLGGSALAQVYNQTGDETPDIEPGRLRGFFDIIRLLKAEEKILAYHDRSDGGLFAVLGEMAFASRSGLDIDVSGLTGDPLAVLFNEELGAVIQVRQADSQEVLKLLNTKLSGCAHIIGRPSEGQTIKIGYAGGSYRASRAELESLWSSTSHHIQKLRDNPVAADQEFATIRDNKDPGLNPAAHFDLPKTKPTKKPRLAIFREQGVNGQVEMAAAFDKAGFTAVDVHLNDIIDGRAKLGDFAGLIACGGFSYGDVLGAGEGWAKTILSHPSLRQQFQSFFERPDSFTLGVCNGCQMLSALKELIPGAEKWPKFVKNASEQFEARLSLVQVNKSPSILLRGMEGSYLPVPVAHGEGRADFSRTEARQAVKAGLAPLQYVDNYHKVAENYPANPNGSPAGVTALTTPDGRATIMMPHPERGFMSRQLSWHPADWGEDSPWFRLFLNARQWVDKQ